MSELSPELFFLEPLGKRNAAQGVSLSHGLTQCGELVARRHWVIAVPQLLVDVRFILTSPL